MLSPQLRGCSAEGALQLWRHFWGHKAVLAHPEPKFPSLLGLALLLGGLYQNPGRRSGREAGCRAGTVRACVV